METELGNSWVMTSIRVAFVLIFVVVQLCAGEYVVYGQKMTLDNNLSLNPNQCHQSHHPLIIQLSGNYSRVETIWLCTVCILLESAPWYSDLPVSFWIVSVWFSHLRSRYFSLVSLLIECITSEVFTGKLRSNTMLLILFKNNKSFPEIVHIFKLRNKWWYRFFVFKS